MDGYDGISSMNHFGSMKIDDNVNFLFYFYFFALSFPIGATPCHFHLLCIHALGCVDEGLQVFILFYAFVDIMWDVPNTPRFNALYFQKLIRSL
jgi:hypothetical protein